jgi:hypothetical protein
LDGSDVATQGRHGWQCQHGREQCQAQREGADATNPIHGAAFPQENLQLNKRF